MITQVQRILIIQTAFIGDVILSTPLLEKLHQAYPAAKIDFLIRKGTESLFEFDHRINRLLIWDKRKGKYRVLWSLLKMVRNNRYNVVVNVHRFASTGWLTWWSGAGIKIGFENNPFSFSYSIKVPHLMADGIHEVDRNLSLIASMVEEGRVRPSLILGEAEHRIEYLKKEPYLVIAPASVWFTKQFPEEKWVELLNSLSLEGIVYLIGSSNDIDLCERLKNGSGRDEVVNLCGKLSLLESAALIKEAQTTYVNDSAPLHMASAVNAPVTAIYCSTIPAFGFGPLSDESNIMQTEKKLSCRPCGLHGKRKCPEDHFKCAMTVKI